MAAKYVLSCSCGEKQLAEARQAGQSIVCPCGRTLEVPTMQGLKKLEKIEDSQDKPRSTSSFLGAAVVLAILGGALVAAGWTYSHRAHSRWNYEKEMLIPDIEYGTPWGTWVLWQDLKQGVRLPEYSDSPYVLRKKVYEKRRILAEVVIGAGIVLIATGLVVGVVGRSRRRRKTS